MKQGLYICRFCHRIELGWSRLGEKHAYSWHHANFAGAFKIITSDMTGKDIQELLN